MKYEPMPCAELICAVAAGRSVQRMREYDVDWLDLPTTDALVVLSQSNADPAEFRVKPTYVQIGEHQIPEPMRVAPALNTPYYFPDISGGYDVVEWNRWEADTDDEYYLSQGLAHLDRESAIAHGRALLALTRVK